VLTVQAKSDWWPIWFCKRSSPPLWCELIRTSLPDYMVPSAFVILAQFPLTTNGKLDIRGCLLPNRVGQTWINATWLPGTPMGALAKIWVEVLRLEQVGIHDNFFALGGDSILSIQIIARAKLAGIQLSPTQHQYPTIAELSQVACVASTLESEQGLVQGS